MMTNNSMLAPPIGGFQQVDGRRLYAHSSGSGGPAVVFLPGAGAVGLDYFGVQQRVAQFTTAVLYDRGGTGYSDPLPLPRTATEVATELRALLRALGLDAPYVLAAHSLGGFYAHRFAQLYPGDVAGLVWLDALHRDWDEFMPPSASLAEVERTAPGLDQLRPAMRDLNDELLADYPEPVRQALSGAHLSAEWLTAGIAERTGLTGIAAELRTGPGLPDVPLVALTASPGQATMDAAMVNAVSRGEQRILDGTAHHRLCFDRPDDVVRAIRDVVEWAA
ncbi:MAG TPA: alpha/beta hydrolase [Pseudonocardiaceae bacterium]|jgi:pimeloyl-ACP methyl ester carboxylesterase